MITLSFLFAEVEFVFARVVAAAYKLVSSQATCTSSFLGLTLTSITGSGAYGVWIAATFFSFSSIFR